MSEERKTGMPRFFNTFASGQTAVVVVLMALMALVILAATVDLGFMIVDQLRAGPPLRIKVDQLIEILGAFLMIFIALELLETFKSYITCRHLQVETVLLVGLIAVGRKIIILDLNKDLPASIVSVAAILASLAAAYYLVRKAPKNDGPHV